MEFQVAGKKVVLRERITLGEGYDILGLTARVDNEDFRTTVPVMIKMIESWEFDGDPSESASYDEMDVFTEFLPISRRVNAKFTSLIQGVAEEEDGAEEESEKN